MRTVLIRFAAAAFCLAATLPAPAQGVDVLKQPAFAAIAERFSPTEGLELAAHINVVLRQYERAIPMYEVLVKASPNRADLWAALAMAYNRAGDPREARDAASIAITLAPHYPHFYMERGIAAFMLGQHADSVADLAHYVKALPLNASAHFYLGLAQAARGEPEAARASLLRARRLNPALSVSTDYYLGMLAADRGQLAVSRELLARTQRVLEGSGLPVEKLVDAQLQGVEGAIGQRLRASMHESDARFAPSRGKAAER